MSYEQARQQALFLTDKMAYELNLTDDQYEAAYEINLDYLMSIDNYDDLYGAYWNQRNLDLSYILLDWQYRSYVNASYFYRPLYWDAGYWHFGIYARYPHRDYYFFGRPAFYMSYRGGHSWRVNGGRSWYNGRRYTAHYNDRYVGMRDGFDRGDYGRGHRISSQQNRSFGNGTRFDSQQSRTRSFGSQATQSRTRSFGNNAQQSRTRSFGNDNGNRTRSFGSELPQSSTRATVTRPGSTRSFGNSSADAPRRTFTPGNGSTRSFGGSSSPAQSRSVGAPTRSGNSFGNSFRSQGGSTTRSFGNGNSSVGNSGGGHFGRNR